MKLKNEYLYCVVQKSGHLCLWSMARNPRDSWLAFRRILCDFNNLSLEDARNKAKAEGHRCVRLRITAAA